MTRFVIQFRLGVAWTLGILATFLGTTTCHPATAPTNHWAFQPVARVEPPTAQASSGNHHPIDRLVRAAPTPKAHDFAPRASREQLIRRVTFGLIGLPPTPEEIDAFSYDRSPDAWDRLIDRLLASPHYGERWARHWLDLARFAESDGFEHDALRPHSWRYRDYVIQSFNEDKPYERFIREQVAGDELWPGEPSALIATAFNLLGPDMVDSADQVQRRLNTLNDATDTTASVFLGLTFGCARCHDHKFEPITQHDYFSMQAFFTPVKFEHDLPVPTSAERKAHDESMTQYRAKADTTQKQLDALEAPHRARLYEQKLDKLSEDAQLAHRTPKASRTMEQEGTVQETAPALKITDAEVVKLLSKEETIRRKQLLDALKKIPKPTPLPMTMALQNSNNVAAKTFVLARGDYNNPREEVQPGFPAVMRSNHRKESIAPRRTALADWIASPSNPLTARVMVNRIWRHHFGRGLVATPGDFGTRGAQPENPALLDWLAGEFITRGWSMKAMHRLILTSTAYQQSSGTDGESPLRPRRLRLEGEAVRDSLLAISGRLNRKIGGPSVSPPIPSDITKVSKNWTASADAAEHTRRSIYILARRNLRFPFLEVFDAPDSNLTCPERGRSTTAPQSLTLLNSDEVMAAATATAKRLLNEAPSTAERVGLAFRLTLGREPTNTEQTMSQDFLHSCSSRRGTNYAATADAAVEDWAEFCRALFNLNAFVYVD